MLKGLGKDKKNLSIKEILRKFKADIIMSQERKKFRLISIVLDLYGVEETKIESLI